MYYLAMSINHIYIGENTDLLEMVEIPETDCTVGRAVD